MKRNEDTGEHGSETSSSLLGAWLMDERGCASSRSRSRHYVRTRAWVQIHSLLLAMSSVDICIYLSDIRHEFGPN